jgi:hypothetical protein
LALLQHQAEEQMEQS